MYDFSAFHAGQGYSLHGFVVKQDAIRAEFPAPCLFIGEAEVIQRYDLFV